MKTFLIASFALLCGAPFLPAQVADNASPTPSPSLTAPPARSAETEQVVITSQALDNAREQIVPNLGATRYTIAADSLDAQAQGQNAPFNQTILRFPGVTQDSFGQLHVRGEHANLQYRIDDVLIPEGISGFGQELQTRFADNVSLVTGALPAQFGFRTTGIIDVHTKNGAVLPGGEASLYGGSFDTFMPSLEYGGVLGKLNYYATSSYLHSGIGIENPTSSTSPIHDDTDQFKEFGYFSYIFDESSRLTLLVSDNHSDFQIPNNPGQAPAFTANGVSHFNSAKLDENQAEDSAYAILTYQKKAGALDFQASAISRYSSVLFRPDELGDLIFNGVASRVDRSVFSNGVQFDASYKLNDQHTLRSGLIFTAEHAAIGSSTLVFPVDAGGSQTTDIPERVVDNSSKTGFFYGVYLQDEWKPFDQLTINFGGRFDVVNAFVDENQLSPRINVVYQLTTTTTLHGGYARYFTPPPLESVESGTIAKFNGTTNASAVTLNNQVKSERAHYFDLGVSQKIAEGWQVGVDAFYKSSHQTLDEGQFGQALILSSFNYDRGEIYGGEFTTSYDHAGFSAYLNAAYEMARGKQISSAQFLFGPDELAYIDKNFVHLDHDQRVTASTGASYTWQGWKVAADLLYGNGLRRGFANTKKLPSYETVNASVQHTFKLAGKQSVIVRFDVLNLFDQVYELRDGSGIGVGAPQFGQRRGFYGTISYDF